MIVLLSRRTSRWCAPEKSIDLCAAVRGSRRGKSLSFVVRIARKKVFFTCVSVRCSVRGFASVCRESRVRWRRVRDFRLECTHRKRLGYAFTFAIALWMLHFFARDFGCSCTRGCHFGVLHLRKWLRWAVTALEAHLLQRNRNYSRASRWVIQSYILYVCLLYFQLNYNIIWYRFIIII